MCKGNPISISAIVVFRISKGAWVYPCRDTNATICGLFVGLFVGILTSHFFATFSKQSSAQHSRWKMSAFTFGRRSVCTSASRSPDALPRPTTRPQASAVLKEIASQYPYEPSTEGEVCYVTLSLQPGLSHPLRPECTFYPSLVCRSQA